MPKAILELEMPESCWQCKYCTIFDVCSILSKRGKSDTYAIVPGEGRHKDCPLKPARPRKGGSGIKKYICKSCGKAWYSAADLRICPDCHEELREEKE